MSTLRRWVACAALAAFGAAAAHTPTVEAIPPTSTKLFMVSDSVGLGAKGAITRAFPGWQVTVTGKPGLFTENLVRYVTQAPVSQFGDEAVVATGYNYPYWAPARFDTAIDQMMTALLAKGVQQVFWVTMREVKPAWYSKWNGLTAAYKKLYLSYPAANDQLRNAMNRWPQLNILDWAAITDQAGVTSDAIHFFGDFSVGAQRYAGMVFSGVMNARMRNPAGTVTEIQVTGRDGVPADALAASLTITAVHPRQNGFVTAYPCGADRPTVANLTHRAAETVAASAVVPLGVDGRVCLYQSSAGHLVVDLNGVFGPESGLLPFTPQRSVDTRGGPAPFTTEVVTAHLGDLDGAPDGPFVAAVSLTGIANIDGVVRVFTCGPVVPPTPSRPVEPGRAQSIAVLVATDANGDVCLHATGGVHMVLDVFAIFPVGEGLQPTNAQRLLDTRSSGGALEPLVDRQVVPPGVGATMLTLTAVGPQGIGFVTARPCGSNALTSVLNVVPNHQQSGSAIVSNATGLCVRSSVATHVLVDVWGAAGAAYTAITPVRLLDTRS
jgi:hypothetical protein